MNAFAFDRLTRFIASAFSRRSFGAALLGAAAGLVGIAQAEAVPCSTGQKRCGQRCIPRLQCCTTADCPKSSGKVCRRGRCVCPASKKRCRNRCIPKAACCGGCPAGLVCKRATCCIGTSAALTAALAPGGPAVLRLCPGTTYRGEFGISRDLILIGAGPSSTVLTGDGSGRVLLVENNTTVELRRIRIANGRGEFGGGVANLGRLVLSGCLVTGNVASGTGGGIYNFVETLTLVNTVVTDNTAGPGGGGIFTYGRVTLLGTSRVANNIAVGNGGGIYLNDGGAEVVMRDASLVTNNDADPGDPESGGGLYGFNPGLAPVTYSGNARVTGNRPNDCTNVACPS